MKLRCLLTDATEYNSFCGLENEVYTVKISRNYKYWYFDLCDMINFYANTNIELLPEVAEEDKALAKSLYQDHSYNERGLREYESAVMVHTTDARAGISILSDGAIKCWNILKQENFDLDGDPIGSLLGDIKDFSNYVMVSPMEANNEIVVASRQKGMIDTDPNQIYHAGYRFYLDAEKLARDGLLLRDGQHVKVKGIISLDKYLIWYATAEKLGLPSKTTPKEFFEAANRAFLKMGAL